MACGCCGLTQWRQIGVAHHARRLGGVRGAKRWIDDGPNPVRFGHFNFSNGRGASLDPNVWYTQVKGSEAGVLIQVGIHQVENMLWLLGPAATVNARLVTSANGPMPDGATVIVGHTSGAVSTITSSWTTPGLFNIELQAPDGKLALSGRPSTVEGT